MAESENMLNTSLLESAHPGIRALLAHNDVIFAFGLAMVLTTLLVPLPTFVMDLLLSISIAVAVATIIVVLSARESIELSAFPSLLLFVTLFRLSLNVATTRLILLNADGGQIIQTFGHFVAGGSLPIGIVVFLILVVIQFVVITKGADRISEVAARFNLDAMPGKQMAIDADLNAGLIGEEEARQRREKVVRESEFYGSMDGASKFIRGAAIAALVITGINLIGGFIVGMTRGMSAEQSGETYSILAIGDGLVSQIPAVIISTAAGFLISKTSSRGSTSHDLISQMISRSRPIGIAAFLLGGMVFVPGFPKLPFIVLALGAGLMARVLAQREREAAKAPSKKKAEPEAAPVEELLDVDRLSIQVGPRLIRVVDPRRKDSLSHRIAPLRRKFAQELGIVLPLIRLRDNVALQPNAYEIRLHNHVVASGKLEPELLLAINPGTVESPVKGASAQEPVFGLPALWIGPDQKEQAEINGYTVVDPESVLVTHLSETLRVHAQELLSRDDVQVLIDRLRKKQPALVDGVIGDPVPIGLLHRVLQMLLKDGIAIRDLAQILETLGDHATRTKDPAMLTELTRKALVRTITEQHSDADGKIAGIIFDPTLEYELRNAITREGDADMLAMSPDRAMEMAQRIADAWGKVMGEGREKVVLLCDYRIRRHLARMLERQLPQLPVLAYDEISIGTEIQTVETIALQPTVPETVEQGT
ncbi:MAG: flagellar biosynthesis protein FlhA [Planctomycetota bacterium]|jgi:flagellar biosynthesis protein FlhA